MKSIIEKLFFQVRRIATLVIVGLLISVSLTPITSSKELTKIEDSKRIGNLNLDDTEYWAVIVAVANYKNPDLSLPVATHRLKLLYDSLLSSENWKKDHIILLINEQATKKNILNALDEMANKVNSNDVFLFAFMGHGSEVSDEFPYDERDGTDEVICPYDVDKINGKLINYITDDELNRKFTKIEGFVFKQTKGLLLIFECCLSGALVDKKWQLEIDGRAFIKEDYLNNFREEISKELEKPYEDPDTTDINGRKRFVIMASVDGTLALVLLYFGGPLTSSLALGFAGYADGDGLLNRRDGWVTAEEAFKFTQRRYVKTIAGYIGGWCAIIFLQEYFRAKYIQGKSDDEALKYALEGVIVFLGSTVLSFICEELIAKISTGHWILSFPTKVDSNPLIDLPITELKRGIRENNDLTEEFIPKNWQPVKPLKPEGQSSGRSGVKYIYKTFCVDPINYDGDAELFYKWDWGDGSSSEWIGPYKSESGEKVSAEHIWNKEGEYKVSVKVKDKDGIESEWSDPLTVKIAKSRDVDRGHVRLIDKVMSNQKLLHCILIRMFKCDKIKTQIN